MITTEIDSKNNIKTTKAKNNKFQLINNIFILDLKNTS
jgi:hypothetical protein